MALGHDLPAGDRARRRGAGRAAAVRVGPRGADLPARRRLPVGRPDLDPEAYGARERHAELGPTEPSLDAFELALARAALERGMPLLGICRGAQALNVACGGTLHQHLPGHRQSEPGCRVSHEVEVLPGTRLAGLIGPGGVRRQLLPPPGGRPPRRRAAGRRPRRRRHGRGDRGRRLHGRRAVARRGARRRPPVRGARRAPPRPRLRVAARRCQVRLAPGFEPRRAQSLARGREDRHPPARGRQALRRDHRGRRPRPRRARGHVRRPARAQRRGQVDDDEAADRPGDRRRGPIEVLGYDAAGRLEGRRARRWASCRSSTTSTRR